MAARNTERPVVVADTITREVVARFVCYKDAAEFTGMTKAGARDQCTKRTVPLKGGMYIRFEDEFDPREVFRKNVRVPIYVTDGRRLRMFYGVDDAAEKLHRAKNTVNWYVTSGSGLGYEWGRSCEGLDALVRKLEERCRSKS